MRGGRGAIAEWDDPLFDRSGNGHGAQVTGAVARATGISGGQGIAFAGSGYLEAASNPAAGKKDITFSLRFKTDDSGSNYKLASGAWWNWGPGSGWIMATHGPEFWSDDGANLILPDQPALRTTSGPASGSIRRSPTMAAASRSTRTASSSTTGPQPALCSARAGRWRQEPGRCSPVTASAAAWTSSRSAAGV
jgi:hypothetical protein